MQYVTRRQLKLSMKKKASILRVIGDLSMVLKQELLNRWTNVTGAAAEEIPKNFVPKTEFYSFPCMNGFHF